MAALNRQRPETSRRPSGAYQHSRPVARIIGRRHPIDHVDDLARRGAAALARRGLVGVSVAACTASISSRACRSRAVLTSRRSASAPMMMRAVLSVISALDSVLGRAGRDRVCPVMSLLMLSVSIRRKSKKAGRTRPLLCASMISASTSVVKDQKRGLVRRPEGFRPRSCRCGCPSRHRS